MIYFLCDLQKQNNFTIYRPCSLYFYFSGLSLRKATAMEDCSYHVLSNEITFQSVELMASEIQTEKKGIIKKKED